MSTLNTNSAITEELFNKVVQWVGQFCRKALEPDNTKMILTEADLQAQIFHHLLCHLQEEAGWEHETDRNSIGVHCNPFFLDEEDLLKIIPDIVILDKQEYSVDLSGGLYLRKGSTIWGSSIVLELKLFRTIYNENLALPQWKKDINKLTRLREKHYSKNSAEKFFPAFVLLARKDVSAQTLDEIRQYALSNEIRSLLFCPSNCSSND